MAGKRDFMKKSLAYTGAKLHNSVNYQHQRDYKWERFKDVCGKCLFVIWNFSSFKFVYLEHPTKKFKQYNSNVVSCIYDLLLPWLSEIASWSFFRPKF